MKRMTPSSAASIDPVFTQLHDSVLDAAEFLRNANENLTAGNQTARQVLSHLVFWHREYVKIASALVQGRPPKFRVGKFRELNALADREFAHHSMIQMSKRLVTLQYQLEQLACALPDANVAFSLKQDSSKKSLHGWAPSVRAHISNHVLRLRRAQKKMRPAHETIHPIGL